MPIDKEIDEEDAARLNEASSLTFEPVKDSASEEFVAQVKATIETTEKELLETELLRQDLVAGWQTARDIVESFQPVPWFIWRLSNFVFSAKGRPNKVSEGLVLGLRRLLFAAASDPVLGKGEKVNNMRVALKTLRSDNIASLSVIHSICRKLQSKNFERAWRPILDDAVIRAHVGFFVGQMNLDFGPGRGMLAGFAGRVGLAILIATGSEDQADETLHQLTTGKTLRDVGLSVYSVDPLQVSALTLSASGCGKDAAFGTLGYAALSDKTHKVDLPYEQQRWLAAFTITEAARTKTLGDVPVELWEVLGFHDQQDKDDLNDLVKTLIRKGHGWNWLV